MIEGKQVTRMLPVLVNIVNAIFGECHDTRLLKSLCLEPRDWTIFSFPFQSPLLPLLDKEECVKIKHKAISFQKKAWGENNIKQGLWSHELASDPWHLNSWNIQPQKTCSCPHLSSRHQLWTLAVWARSCPNSLCSHGPLPYFSATHNCAQKSTCQNQRQVGLLS